MFAHLHCHFTGSYSDSVLRFDGALEKASADGQSAIALTDHGEIPCAYEFHDECRRKNLKPVFGAELYFVEDAQRCIEKNINERFHLVALVKTRAGLHNLYTMLSDSWVKNSYMERRGLVDWELLEKYHGGIVLLSGCFFNIIGQSVLRQGLDAGGKVLERFKDIFGGDFHIELGRHSVPEEEKVNAGLIELAARYDMKPVVTNDVHYLDAGDWLAHEVVMRTRFDRVNDFSANSREYFLKTESEMRSLGFPQDWLEESLAVAGSCEDILLERCPERYAEPGRTPDIDALMAAGEAAYLGKVVTIEEKTALRHATEVLGANHPDIRRIAAYIEGIPRSMQPDTEHIVLTPGRQIKEVIPLKRSLGKIITQWDEKSCRNAGALILPSASSPLAEKLKKLMRKDTVK